MSKFAEPEEMLSAAWKWLTRAVHDGKHPYRTPGLATVDPSGIPRVRKVVLRAADAAEGSLRFYSDSRTSKIKALEKGSTLAWLFWDPKKKLQVRARGSGSILHPDEADRIWQDLGKSQRKDYAALQAPGTIIPQADDGYPEDWEQRSLSDTDPIRLRFRVVDCILTDLDILQLAREGHQRAQFTRTDAEEEWQASWVIP